MVEIYNYNYSNIYLQTIFFPFPLIRHSYENEQHAIQGCKSPSRKCMTYSWRRQPTFVQYNPLSPLKGAAFCKACNKSFKHYKGTVHNSLQKSRVLFKMRDLLKKKFSSRCSSHFKKCISRAVFSCAKCTVSLQVSY